MNLKEKIEAEANRILPPMPFLDIDLNEEIKNHWIFTVFNFVESILQSEKEKAVEEFKDELRQKVLHLQEISIKHKDRYGDAMAENIINILALEK